MLFAISISLDSFAFMTVEGAMLSRVNKLELLKVGVLFGGWQAVVLLSSNVLIPRFMDLGMIGDNHHLVRIVLTILATCIFVGLGISMLWKGLRNKKILETRKDHLNMSRMIFLVLLKSIDGLLVGMGLSFLHTSVNDTFIAIVIDRITGVITGYWLGYEQKSNANLIGAYIFCCWCLISFSILTITAIKQLWVLMSHVILRMELKEFICYIFR